MKGAKKKPAAAVTPMRPMVLDIFHGDDVTDWEIVKEAGIVGVIHKATEGIGREDKLYAQRRKQATDAGLLWGAYHFNTGDDVAAQVAHFFDVAEPDKTTLMALDFEDNRVSNMTAAQARKFLELADAKLGRKLMIYGGNRVKEQVPAHDAFFGAHRLWLCQYGPKAVLPSSWSEYWIWQYTGDGVGLPPHEIAGVASHGIDLNVYKGTPQQLASEWAAGPA